MTIVYIVLYAQDEKQISILLQLNASYLNLLSNYFCRIVYFSSVMEYNKKRETRFWKGDAVFLLQLQRTPCTCMCMPVQKILRREIDSIEDWCIVFIQKSLSFGGRSSKYSNRQWSGLNILREVFLLPSVCSLVVTGTL